MLKDRQEGLRCLHGGALVLTASALYLAWAAIVEWTGWVKRAEPVDTSVYLLGVFLGALWITHGLRHLQSKLGNLGWLESVHIVRQQLIRIVAVLFTIAFVTKDTGVSRFFLISYIGLISVALVLANRYYPRILIRLFFHRSVMRTVVVAPAAELEDLAGWMKSREHFGIQLVGWVGETDEADGNVILPRLGALAELRRIVIEHDVSQVVVSQFAYSSKQAHEITRCVEEAGCRVRFYANSRRYFGTLPVSVEHDGDYTFIRLTTEPLENPANRAIKRTLDIAVSLPVVLFVMPPLVALVALVQAFQSPGPIFHRQFRSGLNRRKFLIYKFRTMHVSSERSSQQAQRQDARVYRFGRFLRRTSLDEIPQFLNVLIGHMSVSGPRPHLLEHDEQFAKMVSAYYTRHFVKPGITGLAQSKGFRGEISEISLLHKRIGYDMFYIRRWSLSLDVQILLNTVRQVFNPPRTAY